MTNVLTTESKMTGWIHQLEYIYKIIFVAMDMWTVTMLVEQHREFVNSIINVTIITIIVIFIIIVIIPRCLETYSAHEFKKYIAQQKT